ncbi:unnamed protein product [Bursaphelenchus xylophilus]|uniref:(pine wood nematode) hypothetical protein n=1 Tax=Bursaphelenchus xylophilus TaxID=6326 RepID=A0A1I7RHW8_BURXY|nr:unnamed protein product [Bursaphelenchus xylophilus]CAG9115317.1 unnamed protein product [Bursaphelenchus xylophilus]
MPCGRLFFLIFLALTIAECTGSFENQHQSCGTLSPTFHSIPVYRYLLTEVCDFYIWKYRYGDQSMSQYDEAYKYYVGRDGPCRANNVNLIIGRQNAIHFIIRKDGENLFYLIRPKDLPSEEGDVFHRHLETNAAEFALAFDYQFEDCYEMSRTTRRSTLRCYYWDGQKRLFRIDVHLICKSKNVCRVTTSHQTQLTDQNNVAHKLFVQSVNNQTVIYFFTSQFKQYIQRYIEGSVLTHLTQHSIHKISDGYKMKKFLNVGSDVVITVECREDMGNCSYYVNTVSDQSGSDTTCLFHLDRFIVTGFTRLVPPSLLHVPKRRLSPTIPWKREPSPDFYFHVYFLASYTVFAMLLMLSLDVATQLRRKKMNKMFKEMKRFFKDYNVMIPKREEVQDVYKNGLVRDLKDYQMEFKEKLGIVEEDPFEVKRLKPERSYDDITNYTL